MMRTRNKIKLYRKKFKITQQELAEHLDVSKQHVSQLEKSDSNPTINTTLRLVDAFKTIVKKKTFGQQNIVLYVEDLFYTEKEER